MRAFWAGRDEIERELRAARPEPRDEFVTGLVQDIHASRRRRLARPRALAAAAVTVVMVSAFGAFGGFGYAATAVSQAAKTVSGKRSTPRVAVVTPAQSQYGKKCGQSPSTGTGTKPAPGLGPPGNPSNNTCPGQSGQK